MTTKEQAIKHIRIIKRKCKGFLSPEARIVIRDYLQAGKMDEARFADAANRGAKDLITEVTVISTAGNAAVPMTMRIKGKEEPMKYRGGPGCGYDFNEVVIAGPLDGEEHDYKCPKCGVQGSYRPPLFPDLINAKPAKQ